VAGWRGGGHPPYKRTNGHDMKTEGQAAGPRGRKCCRCARCTLCRNAGECVLEASYQGLRIGVMMLRSKAVPRKVTG
jgi:hypothetical protein